MIRKPLMTIWKIDRGNEVYRAAPKREELQPVPIF